MNVLAWLAEATMRAVVIVIAFALQASATLAKPDFTEQVLDDTNAYFDQAVPEQLISHLIGKTPDPFAAQFIRLKQIDGGLCGLVNLKNQYGGYVGFQPFMLLDGNLFLQDTSQCRQ